MSGGGEGEKKYRFSNLVKEKGCYDFPHVWGFEIGGPEKKREEGVVGFPVASRGEGKRTPTGRRGLRKKGPYRFFPLASVEKVGGKKALISGFPRGGRKKVFPILLPRSRDWQEKIEKKRVVVFQARINLRRVEPRKKKSACFLDEDKEKKKESFFRQRGVGVGQ